MSERKWSDGWAYEVRRDGSIYMVRGHPATGCHMQFDFYGDEPTARMMVAADDLAEALEGILTRYVDLVNSTDCGFWNPEEEVFVIEARSALAKARGEA